MAFVPELERLITESMDEWKIPGLAVAVVQNGEVVFIKACGLRDVEAHLEVTTDTQFQLMSVAKSFTATGLALLVDEQRMDWKKPVREYIPEFRLQMDVTFTLEELTASADAAAPYAMEGDTRRRAKPWPVSATAAGGMSASIAGLANWLRFHLGKGTFEGQRLLSAGLTQELQKHANTAACLDNTTATPFI